MSAHDNLSPEQFGLYSDMEGLDGPLGSYGAPGQTMAGWQGVNYGAGADIGVMAGI